MDKPIVIVLARDLVLTSLRNGGEAIAWLDESDWPQFLGGRGIRLVTTIAEVTANTQVKVYGQHSYDKKTWVDFARNLDGMTNGYTAVGTYESTYADSPAEFGPYVRPGIQVKNTGSAQSQVRLTSTAVVLFGNFTWLLAAPVSLPEARSIEAHAAMLLADDPSANPAGKSTSLLSVAANGVQVSTPTGLKVVHTILFPEEKAHTWWLVTHKRGGFSHAALDNSQWPAFFEQWWTGILVLRAQPS